MQSRPQHRRRRVERGADPLFAAEGVAEIDAPNSWKKRQQEQARWQDEVRPQALSTFTERSTRLAWSPPLLRELLVQLHLVGDACQDDEFTKLVGSIETLPVKRYPQAIAVACAIAFEDGEELLHFAQKLGVSMTPGDCTINVSPVDSVAAKPAPRGRRKKSAKAA